jgi:hypothetical protein
MLRQSLAALRAARPALSAVARAIVDAVFLTAGRLGTADRVAQSLGLRNRFELARLLRREELPPLHRLTSWVKVLSWLEVTERDEISLCRLALELGRYPHACYRTVKTVTGLSWDELQSRGVEWVLQRFLTDCGVSLENGDRPRRRAMRAAPRTPCRAESAPYRWSRV